MKNFIYKGQQPHHSTLRVVRDNKPALIDLKMSYGDIVSLDENLAPVKSLERNKLLVVTNEIPTIKTSDAVAVESVKEVKATIVEEPVDDSKNSISSDKNKA